MGEEESLRCSLLKESEDSVGGRICNESKKLWRVAGPAIFVRIAWSGTTLSTTAFVGHLGDLELAAISICLTVIVGLTSGLLFGMGSSLETLCGQAFGARQYHMLGIYLQRSWIVLFAFAVALVPIYIFATPILKLFGQADDIAELAGIVCLWMIPTHFSQAFCYPLQTYFQSQMKNMISAWVEAVALVIHIILSWLFISKWKMGLFGAAVAMNISSWIPVIGEFLYIICGYCPLTWAGFSTQAFLELWSFIKLSVASGVMLCLEVWYYTVLIILTGNLNNPKVAVDSLSVCMNISEWELMIPVGFYAATGVRISNELGDGNGKGAWFAAKVAVATSIVIGLVFSISIFFLLDKIALLFTDSTAIINAVSRLTVLLTLTILFNSVQPILSGVAVGSGWQGLVAYVNIACYYIIGIPFGVLLGWVFDFGVTGIWVGMICGTAIQTLVLAIMTWRTDWDQQATVIVESLTTNSSDSYEESNIRNGASC